MNQTHRTLLFACIAAVIFAGCKKDEPTPVDLGYGYFPTRAGHWITYDVDSAWIDELNNRQGQINYPLRETLESNFTDPQGRPAQRVLRELKDSLGNWTPKDVWWQVSNEQRAERAEENLRKIKMVFPVRDYQTWNTNAYNTAEFLTLTYDEVDVPWSVNGISFDSTCLVVSTFVSNLVDTVRYNERYAKNVGLVHRQVDVSRTQYIYPPLPNPPIKVTVGTYLRMTVTDHGNN